MTGLGFLLSFMRFWKCQPDLDQSPAVFCRVAFRSRNMELEAAGFNYFFYYMVYSIEIKCCCLRWENTMSLQWGLKGKL